MPPPAIPTLAHTVGGGVVGGAQARTTTRARTRPRSGTPDSPPTPARPSRGALLAGDRSPRYGSGADATALLPAHGGARRVQVRLGRRPAPATQGFRRRWRAVDEPPRVDVSQDQGGRRGGPGANGGATYARKDHSLASITDRIVGEFDASNEERGGGRRRRGLHGAVARKRSRGCARRASGREASSPVRRDERAGGCRRDGAHQQGGVQVARRHARSRDAREAHRRRTRRRRRRGGSPGGGGGDASSLKSLASRLMQHVGSAEAPRPSRSTRAPPRLKLGGVPAPDAPGAHGTGALAGAAGRLHDVASILIRIGVLEFCEPEGKVRGREANSSGSARRVRRARRLAEGASGGVIEKGYGTGAAAAAAAAAAALAAQHRRDAPTDGSGKLQAPDAAAAPSKASRLSSFFQRAPGGGLDPAQNPRKRNRQSVKFSTDVDRSLALLPPRRRGDEDRAGHGGGGAGAPPLPRVDPAALHGDDGPALAAARRRWRRRLVGLPAFVGPLQALYAWYSGAAGHKTNGEGANRPARPDRRMTSRSPPCRACRVCLGSPRVSSGAGPPPRWRRR